MDESAIIAFKPKLLSMLDGLHAMGEAFSNVFVQHGIHLLMVLYTLSMAWLLVEILLDDDKISTAISKMVKKTMLMVFVWSLLLGWAQKDDGGGMEQGAFMGISVKDFFFHTSVAISDEIGRVGAMRTGVEGCGEDATCAVVELYSTAIVNVLKYPMARRLLQLDQAEKAASEAAGGGALGWVAGKAALGWENLKSVIPGMTSGDGMLVTLVSHLFSFATALLLVWSLATFVFVVNLGDIMMYTAICFGPLLLPFILLERFSCLGSLPCGWFTLAMSGMFYKAVATFLAFLAVGCIQLVVLYSASPEGAQDSAILVSLFLIFFSWVGKEIIESTGNFVSALVGGPAMGSDGGNVFVSFVNRAARGATGGGSKKQPPSNPPGNHPQQRNPKPAGTGGGSIGAAGRRGTM